jgi:predicted nucleotidyltransferase
VERRFIKQIEEVVGALNDAKVPFALIGGLALASHKVVRATRDIDLLVDNDDGDRIASLLAKLGYHCVHRSADAGNHLRGDERVDLLYASRPIARRLLTAAAEHTTSFGKLRVISAEGLIGFKLQAMANDPKRTRDLEDIRALVRENHRSLDKNELREYFQLFNQEALLDELLDEIN